MARFVVNYLTGISTLVSLSGLVISLALVELLVIGKEPIPVGNRAR